MVKLRPIITPLHIGVAVRLPRYHPQLLVSLALLLREDNQRIGRTIHLLERTQHVLQLRRKQEIAILGLRLLAEQKQQHQSLQLLAVFLLHLPHQTREGLVLSRYRLVLLHHDLHHVLQLLVLGLQHLHLPLQPLLAATHSDHRSLHVLLDRPHVLPAHLQQQLPAQTSFLQILLLKVLMVEDRSLLLITANLAKAVHVELPHKRGEVRMFKVAEKDLIGQSGHILNDKRLPVVSPTDDIEVLRILNGGSTYVDDAEGLGQEDGDLIQDLLALL